MKHIDQFGKDEEYFKQYINEQKERINKFKKLFDSCAETEKPRAARFITGRLKDLIAAQFSCNESIDSIRISVEEYAYYSTTNGFSSYSEYVDFLALLIIVGIQEEICIPVSSDFDDDLTRILNAYISKQDYSLTGHLCYPEYYEVFRDYSTGILNYDELISYVNEKWYRSSMGFYWFDSHLRNDNTYTGYWCYVASAALRIKKDYERVTENTKYIV